MTNKKKAFRFEVEILYEGNAGMPRPCTLKNWICDSLKSHRSPPGTFASRELAGRNVVVGENQASISVTCLRVQDSRDRSMKARVMPAHQPKSLVWKYRFLHWPPEHPWTMLYFMKPVTRRGASDALKHDFPGAGQFSLRMLTQEARWKG
jgi:hypothetical protein